MIERIAELNRILISVDELMDKKKSVTRNSVIEFCKTIPVEGRMPDHDSSIEFTARIGLIGAKKGKIILNASGKNFLKLNPEKLYDLSEEQKKYIIRNYFLDGEFRKNTRDCLKCFSSSAEKNRFSWSSVDGIPMEGQEWILEHLRQLDFLKRTSNGFEVLVDYYETAISFIDEKKGLTEEMLKDILKEKAEIGKLAETIVLKYEAKRLKDLGFDVESHCIRSISKRKVNAGYDIESYNGKAKGMSYDRFIEVKGSRSPSLRFIWSPNEIEVAKDLGEKYWIYFQGGIDKTKKKAKNKPIYFQNPYQYFFIDKKMPVSAHGYIVAANMKGELIIT